MTNIYYVYQYIREDLTPYYIGKGKGYRAWQKHSTIPLPSDLTRISILAENLTEDQAFNLEIELIAKYGRKDLGTGILRNKTDGGEGNSGWVPTSETRSKQSVAAKGRVSNRKGVKLSKETCEKISNSNKGKMGSNKGKNFSQEHRQKLSESHKGYKQSEEHLAKRSAALKGRPNPNKGKKIQK